MPPLPPDIFGPGLADVIGWTIVLFILFIAAVALLKYVLPGIFGGSESRAVESSRRSNDKLETVMDELLSEIRLLRKEIRELRDELRE